MSNRNFVLSIFVFAVLLLCCSKKCGDFSLTMITSFSDLFQILYNDIHMLHLKLFTVFYILFHVLTNI